ncbi:hypothetical protein V8F20_001699 [Naviculisporaceae sp. PSN 640]
MSDATQPALQRLQRRLRGALAEDRPLDGLFGPRKNLAGVGPSYFGVGDGVASREDPVLGLFEGDAGGGAAAGHRAAAGAVAAGAAAAAVIVAAVAVVDAAAVVVDAAAASGDDNY